MLLALTFDRFGMESSTTLILHHDDNVGENEVPPLNFAENVVENDVPEENYSYHSEELRSPISTDDENNGNGNENKAWAYLNKWPKESWSKAFFSIGPKIDNVCNNTCEGFNSSILKYRAKPIVTLLEEIRSYIMRTMTSNRLKLAHRSGPLCPMQQSKLEKLKIQSNKWTPLSAGDGRFQVANAWNSHVDVDIKSNTCTCRKWQLTGMPCEHACAAIAWMREKPEDYCHGWLTLEAYNATYKFCVRPAEGQEYWEPTDYIRPVPAPIRKRPGRPKKARRKDANEEGTSSRRTKIKRAYQTKHCSRCGLEGHTMNRCSGQGVNHMPRGWVIICERCGIEGHYMFQGCNGQGVDPMPLNLISIQPMENVSIDMDDTHGPLPTQVTQPDEFDVEPIPLGVKPTPMRGPRPMRGPGFNPPRFNPPRAPRPWR